MKKIGIIVAIEEELNEMLKILSNIQEKEIYDLRFFEGKINSTEFVIVKCGVGKVNAARVTQILINSYNVKYIFNIGVAGALNPELNIGDIVIADKLVQHDFDITAFEHKKGYITGVGDYIYSNEELVNKFQEVAKKISDNNFKIKKGIIATGDIFCTEVRMKEKIFEKFSADCVEMEGAAIAQVCYLDKIPFIVIRSISDSPNGNNAIVFDEFVSLASKRCVKILKKFMEII